MKAPTDKFHFCLKETQRGPSKILGIIEDLHFALRKHKGKSTGGGGSLNCTERLGIKSFVQKNRWGILIRT